MSFTKKLVPKMILLLTLHAGSAWANCEQSIWITSTFQFEYSNLLDNEATRDTLTYARGMQASIPEKLNQILPWIPLGSKTILDMGSGTGDLAVNLGSTFPSAQVTGVDLSEKMIDQSNSANYLPNVKFRRGNATQPTEFEQDIVIMSSLLHEVFSYAGDSMVAVSRALEIAHQSLSTGGRLIIRDFIKPSHNQRVILIHQNSDIATGHSFEDFAANFGRKVRLDQVKRFPNETHYYTDLHAAYEYMYRKNYHSNWNSELQEMYGFWTLEQAQRQIEIAGFNMVSAVTTQNPWIMSNRLIGKIRLISTEDGNEVPLPMYQAILVAEKQGLAN